MKKIKVEVNIFFLNLAGMSVLNARSYLKMPVSTALQLSVELSVGIICICCPIHNSLDTAIRKTDTRLGVHSLEGRLAGS